MTQINLQRLIQRLSDEFAVWHLILSANSLGLGDYRATTQFHPHSVIPLIEVSIDGRSLLAPLVLVTKEDSSMDDDVW